MITEWEIWACAQEVIRQRGGKADEWIAGRIDELAGRGDAEGVATWRAIAARVEQLTDFRGSGRPRH